MPDLAYIALAWALYGLVHSWLAGDGFKQRIAARWARAMPAYRLAYNLLATLLLIPPVWLAWRYAGEPLWSWPAWVSWPAAVAACAGFAWSLRWYDGLDFLGLRQWRARAVGFGDPGRLVLSPMHRYVRHPWYSLGLLLIWTRDLNAAWLTSAVMVTLYTVIGSRLEDRKLIAAFGDVYRRYMRRVPGLLPIPGRALDDAGIESLRAAAGSHRDGP